MPGRVPGAGDPAGYKTHVIPAPMSEAGVAGVF